MNGILVMTLNKRSSRFLGHREGEYSCRFKYDMYYLKHVTFPIHVNDSWVLIDPQNDATLGSWKLFWRKSLELQPLMLVIKENDIIQPTKTILYM